MRANSVAANQNRIEILVSNYAGDFPISHRLNDPDFPDRCLTRQFFLVVNVLEAERSLALPGCLPSHGVWPMNTGNFDERTLGTGFSR